MLPDVSNHLRRSGLLAGLGLIFLLSSARNQSLAQEFSAPGARKIMVRVQPAYPSLARSMKIRGSVKIEAVVAANGSVKSVEVKGGHPLLAQSAQNAVREWKWEPAAHETREPLEIKFEIITLANPRQMSRS